MSSNFLIFGDYENCVFTKRCYNLLLALGIQINFKKKNYLQKQQLLQKNGSITEKKILFPNLTIQYKNYEIISDQLKKQIPQDFKDYIPWIFLETTGKPFDYLGSLKELETFLGNNKKYQPYYNKLLYILNDDLSLLDDLNYIEIKKLIKNNINDNDNNSGRNSGSRLQRQQQITKKSCTINSQINQQNFQNINDSVQCKPKKETLLIIVKENCPYSEKAIQLANEHYYKNQIKVVTNDQIKNSKRYMSLENYAKYEVKHTTYPKIFLSTISNVYYFIGGYTEFFTFENPKVVIYSASNLDCAACRKAHYLTKLYFPAEYIYFKDINIIEPSKFDNSLLKSVTNFKTYPKIFFKKPSKNNNNDAEPEYVFIGGLSDLESLIHLNKNQQSKQSKQNKQNKQNKLNKQNNDILQKYDQSFNTTITIKKPKNHNHFLS